MNGLTPPQDIKIFLHNNNTGQTELEKVEKFEYLSQIDLFRGNFTNISILF